MEVEDMVQDTNENLEQVKKDYQKLMYAYAESLQQKFRDTKSNKNKSTSFSKYEQSQIYEWLKAPARNEKNLRNASIYFYNTSSHYKRLITYVSGLPEWSYIISPYKFDSAKINSSKFEKQYINISKYVEQMNLKHEMFKAATITLRDGVFYGAIWESGDTWFLQRINPDYCVLSSIVNGTWNYEVDMSKIDENELTFYPPSFTTMWKQYQSSGDKYQEVPPETSFCLKADETESGYSIPPFISVVPLLYAIENYKELQQTGSEIENYKLISFDLPTREDATPAIDKTVRDVYLNEINSGLPDYVGAVAVPFKTSAISFDKSGMAQSVDEVARAEEQYWSSSGVSSLLFGSAKNTSSSAMELSIRTDEELIIPLLSQIERL